jgi:hypothetical protein
MLYMFQAVSPPFIRSSKLYTLAVAASKLDIYRLKLVEH